MKKSGVPLGSIGLIAYSIVAFAGIVLADGPQPAASPPAPAPAMPAGLVRQVQGITDAVLENHIDPPARQQMILSGIKALYREAGVPAPPSLGRRISATATPEQFAALLAEVWPGTTARPLSAAKLERTLLEGLLASVPGQAELMTVKERNAAEQIAGNRYVGILVALGRDEKVQRPTFSQIMEGGPAARAEIKKDSVLEEVDGVDTKGMELREVVERLRGDEGTDVNIKVREPKAATSRAITLTRSRIASDRLMTPTVQGIRKDASGDWDVRLDVPDPIGYVKIALIIASTPHELRKMASRMENAGVRALVLDLRGTRHGGTEMAMHSAVLVADSLLEQGTIGRVRTTRGQTTYQADSDALFRGWPIAVLVDNNTGGVAEWLAAALQDNRRAVIVGSPSRGAHQARPFGGLPMEDDGTGPFEYEAAVMSTVPVGDGRWSITMVTGHLERGDGRPLADVAGANFAAPRSIEKPKGGVQPDYVVPGPRPGVGAPRGPIVPRRTPNQRGEPSNKPAGKPDSSADPTLNAAVKVLHEALRTR